MAQPLRLFVQPPYPGEWTLVHGYGLSDGQFHSNIELQSAGPGQVIAAASGWLSANYPSASGSDPATYTQLPQLGAPLPESGVTLYLRVSALDAQEPAFAARSALMEHLVGFMYVNLDAASLEPALAELLDQAVAPSDNLTRRDAVELLVQGVLHVYVPTGHVVGSASAQGAPAGFRQIGFAALNNYGPIDPAYTYDWMSEFVADGQQDREAFHALVPVNWPVSAATADDAVSQTKTWIFTLSVLQDARKRLKLSDADWRQIGDNQKALYRNRLLQRRGPAASASTDPPFEFNDADWMNPFQLEAIVEYYVNYSDPWAPNTQPKDPIDETYVEVSFLEPAGLAATLTSTPNEPQPDGAPHLQEIQLDGAPDLSQIRTHHNVLTGKPEWKDRIVLGAQSCPIRGVDNVNYTVTVSADPPLTGGPWAWNIKLRPILVLIDSFGGRERISGTRATVVSPPYTVVALDGLPKPSKINRFFDTIYFPADVARASRTYRIIDINEAKGTVTLDAAPQFVSNNSSAWYIPAGIGGKLPMLQYSSKLYDLGPGGPRTPAGTGGFDHYDGVLFVIQGGVVHEKLRWSSYTSCNYPVKSQALSSIRGNQQYDYTSFRSPPDEKYSTPEEKVNCHPRFRNYCFAIGDVNELYDGVRNARFYFRNAVADDSVLPNQDPTTPGNDLGKKYIRIHRGSHNGKGSGSGGCLVSPDFFVLRMWLIRFFQEEAQSVQGANAPDDEITKAYGSNDLCEWLWTNTSYARFMPEHRLKDEDWDGKIAGTLWLIRPDERPVEE